uniref:DNA-directed RNA polymerase subunit beta n=1 Tax=Pterocladiophila hemisphaerica TaxID=2712948 RepID=A0A6M3WWF5_9FLOR|nr:RpoB [Pterocladiophila hemisphaerica]
MKKTFLIPDLTEIQINSFKSFLFIKLPVLLETLPNIHNFTKNLVLHFFAKEYKIKFPRYNIKESKQKDKTYDVQIYLPVQCKMIKSDIVIEKEINFNNNINNVNIYKKKYIFLGNLPLITNKSTFIINGTERIVIHQIIRSPGLYYTQALDQYNKKTYTATLISNRGSWLKFEIDRKGYIWIKIDKICKINAYIFLRAIGLSHTKIALELLHYRYFIEMTNLAVQKDINEFSCCSHIKDLTEEQALFFVYNKIRPNEIFSIILAKKLLYDKFFNLDKYDLGEVGRFKLNQKLKINLPLEFTVLSPQDILKTLDYLINITKNKGYLDDIDHLGCRRLRSVGELLFNQFQLGLIRLERIIREQILMKNINTYNIYSIINPRPITTVIKEFFNSSQLSQFMDQINPLAELTHKRRITSLGPGGLNKDRTGFSIRDLHPSHYGRICPVDTPEGPNAGLIGSLTLCSKVNRYGFLLAPYYEILCHQTKILLTLKYLTADIEDKFRIAPGDILLQDLNKIETVSARYQQEFIETTLLNIDFISISPVQIISIATTLIPFLEHDDANRALMGSNMQRQAVPLLFPEKPLIGTGLEHKIAKDTQALLASKTSGFVTYISSSKIGIKNTKATTIHYRLKKYFRSNQDTCYNQRAIIWPKEKIKVGQIIADGASTDCGEMALGKNIFVAYMAWKGFNYEDAFVINERLIRDDVFTSIHIEKYELECRETKSGPELITKDIPYISKLSLTLLDNNGIIKIGSWVKEKDILVGKTTPKNTDDYIPENKLLKAIFGEKFQDRKDTSLRLPSGVQGRVTDVKIFYKDQNSQLNLGINTLIKIYIAQKRNLQIGDKISGRHGNKGVISKILPQEDMPFLLDGTIIDLMLNPLGVPSRMNLGQLFESLLGLSGHYLKQRYKLLPFDEMYGLEASRVFINMQLKKARFLTKYDWLYNKQYPGKMIVRNAETGDFLDNPITVGKSYILKLVHLVDDKIHARSTGPYSLITQQPLGGRSQQGGQRFGEMEVWALEGFGAAHILQELLTIKSDDMKGRNQALHAIIKGLPLPKPGIPESFKVLLKELQSLCLDVSLYKKLK